MLIGRRFTPRPFTQNVCINQSYRLGCLMAIRFWQGSGTICTSDVPLVIAQPAASGTPTWTQNKSQGPSMVFGNAKYNFLTSVSPGNPTDPMVANRNAFTIGIKLYVNSLGTDHIAYCETGGGAGVMGVGRVFTDNTFHFGRYTPTNGVELASVTTAKARQPYWIFSTFNANGSVSANASMKLYVDGLVEAFSNVAIKDGRDPSFGIIGAYIASGTNPPFDGGLEFLGLWNRELDPREIALVTETDGGILYDRVGGQFFSLAGGQSIPNATGSGSETFGPMTEAGSGTYSPLTASCGTSELIALDPCKVALGEYENAILKTQLLCNWKAKISGDPAPVTCDINTLLEQGQCFQGLTLFQLKAVQVQLLCDIYNIVAGTPDADCDVNTLLAEAKCIAALPLFIVKAIQTQLLCNVSDIYST